MTAQRPLRELLDDDVSEAAIQRIWKGVRRPRAARVLLKRRYLVGLVSAAAVALLALVWLRAPHAEPGPLREANGHPLNALGALAASSTWLADGSHIDLGPGSALEVLDNDASSFVCVLRRGRGSFDVKPGGPRRWRVEAGALSVEVVGTRFSVERSDERVNVDVEHGTVLVRGERVPDGVQKLTAGSHLLVDLTEPVRKPSPAASAAPQPSLPVPQTSAAPANVDLLQLADEQRRRGNVKGAIVSLRSVVGSADASRRAIAAFTLGKLLLDSAGRPGDAAEAFRTCLRSAPPASVAEDASARLVEALSRAGNVDGAARNAREYERRYPSGRRLADVRRWASSR
ncbi:MAG: FecR family protein [Polyangiaceae bacterium]